MKTTITKEIEIELPELPELPEPKKGHKWELRGLGWKNENACIFAFVWIDSKIKEWEVIWDIRFTIANPECFYAELIRTHREDGTPLEIEPLPEMPDNVERVEYFGMAMKPEDMGDADTYLYFNEEWWGIEYLQQKSTHNRPLYIKEGHYARVWYKKEKPAPTEPLPEIEGWRFDLSKGKWGMTKWEYREIGCDGWIVFHGKWLTEGVVEREPKGHEYFFYVPAYKTEQKTRLQDLIGEDYQGRAYIVMINDYWINFHPAKSCNSLGFEDSRYGLNQNTRWSHSPFTSFEDAKPFVF